MLGLKWHPEQDIFEFSIQSITSSSKTKREVLSAISRLFDPLGLINPILIRAKLIMQEIWATNLGWDDSSSIKLQQAWSVYVEDLKEIHTIQIPRRDIGRCKSILFICILRRIIKSVRSMCLFTVNLYFNLPTSNDFDFDICCQGHYPE